EVANKGYVDGLFAFVTTTDVAEGTGLYFTNARADARADVRIAAARGAALGVASLDAASKLPSSQLPNSILGGVVWKGTWNATTNSPTIPTAAAGNKGWYYVVATAGGTSVGGITDWKVNDWIISS